MSFAPTTQGRWGQVWRERGGECLLLQRPRSLGADGKVVGGEFLDCAGVCFFWSERNIEKVLDIC